MPNCVQIGGRTIGHGYSCWIIAEAGVNHNGDLELAKQLVDAAVAAGADAIKFQTFRAAELASPEAPKAMYQLQSTDQGESQLEMLMALELPGEVFGELAALCREKEILFLSSAYDKESVDLLFECHVEAFKIASGEITNLPLLEYVAGKGKPVLLSTGMSYLSEVDEAVRVLREGGCDQLVLLHCVSDYPADSSHINLRAMATLSAAFDLPVGYSDHTLGAEVAIAAVALGACVLEKHFTLDRGFTGPDHRASLEPEAMAEMVRSLRLVEQSLGHGRKEPTPGETEIAAVVRRSLVLARDLPAGSVVTDDALALQRPGTGLPLEARPYVVGRTARVALPQGTLLSLEMLA